MLADNFSRERLDANYDSIREKQDRFEEENEFASDLTAGVGMLSGLFIPGATLAKGSKLAKAGVVAAEGAVYGAGTDDGDRLEGAMVGGALGGALGAGAVKLQEVDTELMKDAEVTDEVEVIRDCREQRLDRRRR